MQVHPCVHELAARPVQAKSQWLRVENLGLESLSLTHDVVVLASSPLFCLPLPDGKRLILVQPSADWALPLRVQEPFDLVTAVLLLIVLLELGHRRMARSQCRDPRSIDCIRLGRIR